MGTLPAQLLRTPYSNTNQIWRKIQLEIPMIGRSDAVSYPGRRNRFVGKCRTHVPSAASIRGTRLDVFEILKSEIFNDPVFEWTDYSRQWMENMIDYNVPRGKLLRSLSLIDCYKSLKEGEDLTEDELFRANVIGWCIEWFQASLLIHDDIMDNSKTRRGQACWYRVPKVGNKAINDGVVLQYQIPRILKKHFEEEPYYMDLLNLFNEVEYQTVLGQMMDVITTVEGEGDILNYSWTLRRLIAHNKASCYSLYLPVASALLLAGENLDDHGNVKDVLSDIGNYFQVLDDYQDCFGDSETIGTDIEDCKCSWLVLKAMEICNEKQKKILLEHYGKANPVDVRKVKALYNDLDLQSVCVAYLRSNYERLQNCVEAHPSKAVHAIWARYTTYLSQWL